jgi:two-component system OmpR family response regulator
MEPTPHVLVVDDSADIREPLARYLTKKGLRVSTATGAQDVRRMVKGNAFDLVVLDIMMPGEDGLSLCRFLQETSDMPVILLTAMVEETDRIVGLEIGADDYVTKPFSPRELLARIRAVLRRTQSMPSRRDAVPANKQFRFGRWRVDAGGRELLDQDNVAVPLSTAEFRLLLVFLQRPHMVLTREQLLDLTAGRALEPFERSIDNQVSRLRKKIEDDPKKPMLIKTVWGGGYVLASDVEEIDH